MKNSNPTFFSEYLAAILVKYEIFLRLKYSYAHDDQGDNPGQATTVSSIKCDHCWHLD